MRGAGSEINDLGHGPISLAGAWAEKVEVHLEGVKDRMVRGRLARAQHAQSRAGSVQVRRGRREKPMFQFLKDLLLLFGLLEFREPGGIGITGELGRQGTVGAEEQDGDLL